MTCTCHFWVETGNWSSPCLNILTKGRGPVMKVDRSHFKVVVPISGYFILAGIG